MDSLLKYNEEDFYFPMLVNITSNQNDKDDAFISLWNKFYGLPKKNQNILTSEKIRQFIYGASQQYNLNDTKTEEFSRTIRQYFFNEIVDGQFARKISELCNISNEQGLEILKSIKNIQSEEENVVKRNLVTGQISSNSSPKFSSNINFSSNISSTSNSKHINKNLSSTTSQISNIVQIPVRKALNLYPKLNSQNITENPIVAKSFVKPAIPNIKNWLTVYEELMGVGKKGAIDRGNFLFHSEPAKNLSTEDRQNLAKVLKSADEDSNLKIDTIKGRIIFAEDAFEKKPVINNIKNNFKIKPEDNLQKTKIKQSDNFLDNKKEAKAEKILNNNNFYQSINNSNLQKVRSDSGSIYKNNQTSSIDYFKNQKGNKDNFKSQSLKQNNNNFNQNNFVNRNIVGDESNHSANETEVLKKEKLGNNYQSQKDNISFNEDNEKNITFTSNHFFPVEKK